MKIVRYVNFWETITFLVIIKITLLRCWCYICIYLIIFVKRKCWIFTFKVRYTFLQDTLYRVKMMSYERFIVVKSVATYEEVLYLLLPFDSIYPSFVGTKGFKNTVPFNSLLSSSEKSTELILRKTLHGLFSVCFNNSSLL